jgi:hypothetical protein
MKYLTILALLGSLSAYAQGPSPSAVGTSITSPSGSIAPGGSGFTSPPVDTGSIPNTNNALNVAPTSNSNAFNVAPGTATNSYNISPGTLGNDLNTAPSTIPTDTTLLNNTETIPTNNPPAQAQEFDSFGNPNTTTVPGSDPGTGTGTGVGTGVGTGTSGSDIVNPTSPIPSP